MKNCLIALAFSIAMIHNQSQFEASYKHYPSQPPVSCHNGKAVCS